MTDLLLTLASIIGAVFLIWVAAKVAWRIMLAPWIHREHMMRAARRHVDQREARVRHGR